MSKSCVDFFVMGSLKQTRLFSHKKHRSNTMWYSIQKYPIRLQNNTTRKADILNFKDEENIEIIWTFKVWHHLKLKKNFVGYCFRTFIGSRSDVPHFSRFEDFRRSEAKISGRKNHQKLSTTFDQSEWSSTLFGSSQIGWKMLCLCWGP